MLSTKRLWTVAAILLTTAVALGGCTWRDVLQSFYDAGARYCDDNPNNCGD